MTTDPLAALAAEGWDVRTDMALYPKQGRRAVWTTATIDRCPDGQYRVARYTSGMICWAAVVDSVDDALAQLA